MNRKNGMVDCAKDTGRKYLGTFVVGYIKSIVNQDLYTAEQKVQEIKETLVALNEVTYDDNLPWDMTEPSALTEGNEEITQVESTTNHWTLEQ